MNPVTWHTLAHHGAAIRGPERHHLQIRADEAELRTWTLGNLNDYWRRWAKRTRRAGLSTARALPRHWAAAGVLGAPRLHYTVTTGGIVSKEAAAQYALEVFEPRWHLLARSPATTPLSGPPDAPQRDAAGFVASVIEAATYADR